VWRQHRKTTKYLPSHLVPVVAEPVEAVYQGAVYFLQGEFLLRAAEDGEFD
jgi:hypothetical protein